MSWSLALLLSLFTAGGDPRIALVELQLDRDHLGALEKVEQALAEHPEMAQELGFDYLRGHLLQQLERRQEAVEAFLRTMSTAPQLDTYSRFQLALEERKLGHPEVAAGLVAHLLEANPPQSLIAPAAQLLFETLAEGGDCRLLRQIQPLRFADAERRALLLAVGRCALRNGDPAAARQRFLELLEEDRRDEIARLTAAHLRELDSASPSPRADLLIGLSFHNHRQFDLAIQHLSRLVGRPPEQSGISRREAFESRYALARSHFWEERFAVAATQFGALAAITREPGKRAQALYQQARCFELLGSWGRASAVFQRVYQAEPRGRWAAAAVFSYLRLQWRTGHEEEALQAYEALIAEHEFATASRALVFLASSDLVQGRSDRAEAWLGTANRIGKTPKVELAYWRGRLSEQRGELDNAARQYLRALLDSLFHPLARAAAERLSSNALIPEVQALGKKLAASSRLEDLYSAWLLLGNDSALGQKSLQELTRRLWSDPGTVPFLNLSPEPMANWKLWELGAQQPEARLLALGLFREGAPVFHRYFPLAKPTLAFTGALVLSQAGETHRSLYLMEVLNKRIPRRLPDRLLPNAFRRLLFPLGYEKILMRETVEQGVDPYLLAAIIREESRFDPHAFSAAAARGLTQFVLPTADRISKKTGLEILSPRDLERPEIAIALGAAYLRELQERFGTSLQQIIAAYNAGEPQAELWQRYCFSREPEEYLSKVGFRETRAYLGRVLSSHAQYRELYVPSESSSAGRR